MLENKIADRLKKLQDDEKSQAAAAEKAATEAEKAFTAKCTELVHLAKAAGVTGEIIPATLAESLTPYCSFTVAGVNCSIEGRDIVIRVLVAGRLASEFNMAQLTTAPPTYVEQVLIEAIANLAHQGGEVALSKKKGSDS